MDAEMVPRLIYGWNDRARGQETNFLMAWSAPGHPWLQGKWHKSCISGASSPGVLCTVKPPISVGVSRMHAVSPHYFQGLNSDIPERRLGKLQNAEVSKSTSNQYPLEEEMQTSFWTLASGLIQNKALPAQENSFLGAAFQWFEGVSTASFCGGEVGILFCFVFVFRFHLLNKYLLLPTMCRVLCSALMIPLWIWLSPWSEREQELISHAGGCRGGAQTHLRLEWQGERARN